MTRFETIGDERTSLRKYGILGVPWDGAASLGRPGARYAPGKVREAFGCITRRIQNGRIAAIEMQKIVDLRDICIKDFGDVPIVWDNYQETFNNMEKAAIDILCQGFMPLAIGGDHSISYPLVKALQSQSEGNVGLIQFDAHLDLLDASASQGRFSHSSEIRRALDLERVHAENVVQIGVRGFNYPDDLEFVRTHRIKQFTPQMIRTTPLDEVVRETLEIARNGTEKIYMTLDIDVLDPVYAPACGSNEPGGLTIVEVESLVQGFAPHIDFVDVAEVNPIFDVNDMTSSVAAKLLANTILGNMSKA